jgi:pimeloyl-ACP methyl ester carboxylesterase
LENVMSFTVSTVPHLPAGFTDTFTSRVIEANGIALHAVVGGDGPPVLLLPAWPQFWYGWRLVMPALAEHFTVVAADVRGTGASDKPADGYDAATLADDMAAVMAGLGHERFAVAGYDLGMIVGYALAASHRERVTRLAVAEAILPGLSPSPPLFMDAATNEFLWHFAFNRLQDVNERMVAGREEIYFGHQFSSKAASPDAIPSYAVDVYVDALREPNALRASFEFYRAEESSAHILRWQQEGPLAIPVLAMGGERASGSAVEQVMRLVADDVTGLVVPGVGHFLPEEAPDAMAKALLDFLG